MKLQEKWQRLFESEKKPFTNEKKCISLSALYKQSCDVANSCRSLRRNGFYYCHQTTIKKRYNTLTNLR